MNTIAHRIHDRPRYRYLRLFRCTAAALLVVTGGLASVSYAEEHLPKADSAWSHTPAHFQAQPLDEKTLSAIHGKGGTAALQLPLNLSIILWDEPGHGGSKPQALAGNNLSESARGLAVNGYENVSIGKK